MRIKLLLIFTVFGLTSQAQHENGLVNWLTFKEAQEKNKVQQKPFLIDIYTDWCGWCKHMMKTTYSNPNIANYVNTHFYPVKFDGETKDTIEYNGKVYYPTSKNPKTPHQLTIKFLGNSLSYPSTMFVANNYEYNLLTQGFLEEKKIEPVLVYLVENVFKTTQYEDFSERFTKTFYDTTFAKIPVKMYSYKEAIELSKKKPKKILVNIYTDFCNSCTVMKKTTFLDSSLATYINKNFYLVNYNAESADTVIYNNEKHFKQLVNGYPLNTFAVKITNGKLAFPSISVLDEKQALVEVLNMYQHPKNVKPVLEYFGSNAYKTIKWPDYIADYFKPKK